MAKLHCVWNFASNFALTSWSGQVEVELTWKMINIQKKALLSQIFRMISMPCDRWTFPLQNQQPFKANWNLLSQALVKPKLMTVHWWMSPSWCKSTENTLAIYHTATSRFCCSFLLFVTMPPIATADITQFRDHLFRQPLWKTTCFSAYTQPIWTNKVSRSICSSRPFICL
jgi:hypothetical protein